MNNEISLSLEHFKGSVIEKNLPSPSNTLIKGKIAQIGEIREWNGQKYQKTANGWVEVTQGRQPGKEEGPKDGKDGKKEEGGGPQKLTPENLDKMARQATEADLHRTIKESGNEQLRQAAHKELERRQKEEAPKKEGEKKSLEEVWGQKEEGGDGRGGGEKEETEESRQKLMEKMSDVAYSRGAVYGTEMFEGVVPKGKEYEAYYDSENLTDEQRKKFLEKHKDLVEKIKNGGSDDFKGELTKFEQNFLQKIWDWTDDTSIKDFDGIYVKPQFMPDRAMPTDNYLVFKDGEQIAIVNKRMVNDQMFDKYFGPNKEKQEAKEQERVKEQASSDPLKKTEAHYSPKYVAIRVNDLAWGRGEEDGQSFYEGIVPKGKELDAMHGAYPLNKKQLDKLHEKYKEYIMEQDEDGEGGYEEHEIDEDFAEEWTETFGKKDSSKKV